MILYGQSLTESEELYHTGRPFYGCERRRTVAELDTIISAVCNTLITGGISAAISQSPIRAKMRHSSPVVTVGLKGGENISCGFAEYMGMRFDEDTSQFIETYGKRMEMSLALHIYSPKAQEYGAEGCLAVFSERGQLLPQISGIKNFSGIITFQ